MKESKVKLPRQARSTMQSSASAASIETLTQYNLATRESAAMMLTKIYNEQ
mgnify:CR=1 FL=1